MSQFLRINLASVAFVFAAFATQGAFAGQIRGAIDPPKGEVGQRTLGYARTQIGAPNVELIAQRAAVAIFLKAKESHSIPPPTEHQTVRLVGYQIVPDISSCAVDGKVTFINEAPTTVTLTIGGKDFAALKTGESKEYVCAVGEEVVEQRKVSIKEWSHAEAAVYVGSIGVAGVPDEKGAFVLNAPQGQYELQVVAKKGVVFTKELEVQGKSNVTVPKIELGPKEDKDGASKRPPPQKAPPPKKPAPKKPAPPPADSDESP